MILFSPTNTKSPVISTITGDFAPVELLNSGYNTYINISLLLFHINSALRANQVLYVASGKTGSIQIYLQLFNTTYYIVYSQF